MALVRGYAMAHHRLAQVVHCSSVNIISYKDLHKSCIAYELCNISD